MDDKHIYFPDIDGDDEGYTFIPDDDGDDDEMEMVDIEFADGTSGSYQVIVKFEIEGRDCTYAALLPTDAEEDDEVEILIYRYSDEGDEVTLDEIDDEEEFNEVTAVLDEIFDNEEFNSEDE